jgi:hypothetical protein
MRLDLTGITYELSTVDKIGIRIIVTSKRYKKYIPRGDVSGSIRELDSI